MNMETVRLTNVSWNLISDRQVFALRAPRFSGLGLLGKRQSISSDVPARRVPMLDWPADLFDDGMSDR